MRALKLLSVICVLLMYAGITFADDTQVPLPNPTSNAYPPSTITAPPPSENPTPIPETQIPIGEVPIPIAPSLPADANDVVPCKTPIPEQPGDFIYFSADNLRTTYEEGVPAITRAQGNVTAHYKDVTITAKNARVDYKTNIATFEGDVVFKIGIQEVHGFILELNLKTKDWRFIDANSIISPQFAQGYLNAPVFLEGISVQGVRDQEVIAKETEATTCNLEEPHYELLAKSVAVYPNSKLVFRDVTLNALGKRLLTLPKFVIPLRQIRRNPNLIPRFGQTVEEGAFLKTAYSYMGTATQTGFLLLDLMTRKGVGQGINHSYNFSNACGDLSLYHIFDRNINQDTVTGKFTHSQRLGTVQASVYTDLRSNSYLYQPISKTMSNRISLTRDRENAVSSLIVSSDINNVFDRTSQLTGYLTHDQYFENNLLFHTDFDYDAFRFQDSTGARLTSNLSILKAEEKFDWSLSARKITDLTDEAFVGVGPFAGIERLPEVALSSDTARLGKILPFGLPARLKLSFGNFVELPANTELGRALIDINTPNICHSFTNSWGLIANAGFRQFLYSDNTAQYSIETNADLRKKLGARSSFALTYRYQQPQGYTPFRFDFIGRYNIVNASLNIQETQRLKLSLLTGYSFQQPRFPWQNVLLRFSVQPTNSLLLYTATGYDPNTSRWQTLINQLRIRAGDTFKFDLGTRFDTRRNKLAQIRGLLDTQLGCKWRVQAIAGYSPITSEFDYRSLRLTRDLHCWEASLTYVDQGGFYLNKGIMLTLRIKAFPLLENFGIGQFGAAQDTSVGQVY